jgi:hypothetical protein
VRQRIALGVVEICRPPDRQQLREPQNFNAQVVSETSEEGLVEQQRPQLASRKPAISQPRSNAVFVERDVEYVRPEALQERVLVNFFSGPDGNVGRAVKKNGAVRRFKRHAQYPVRGRALAGFGNAPDTVELVVAVKRQAVIKARQQRLALRLDRLDTLADELLFLGFELGEREPGMLQWLTDHSGRQGIGSSSNFRTFGHLGQLSVSVRPPSPEVLTRLTQMAASAHKKTATAATSAASPNRFAGPVAWA